LKRVSSTIALAGDTMLGRGVAEALAVVPPEAVVSPDVVEFVREADLFVLNLECCISERGSRWPDPAKPFFFRAPPVAVEVLLHLGVDCVTLANNHALDFGVDALQDTLAHLASAGIAAVGAGPDVSRARAGRTLDAGGLRVAVIGVTDHPADYAAGNDTPGVAFADLRRGLPDWLTHEIAKAEADAVLVTPHWGPNMTSEPVRHVRDAAASLLAAGAAVVAGHSAHVFHGVLATDDEPRRAVLFDLGDFLDDYAVDRRLRNDLGLFFLVTIDGRGVSRLEVLPLKLDYCATARATGEDAAWVRRRFRTACAAFGTEVTEEGDRLVIELGGG
jgi:poly-gamma-glutamate synthesis protein (capsule biosynthesis protein)